MHDYRTPHGRKAASRYVGLIRAVRSRRLTVADAALLVHALGVLEQEAGCDQSPPDDILALAMGVGIVRSAL